MFISDESDATWVLGAAGAGSSWAGSSVLLPVAWLALGKCAALCSEHFASVIPVAKLRSRG